MFDGHLSVISELLVIGWAVTAGRALPVTHNASHMFAPMTDGSLHGESCFASMNPTSCLKATVTGRQGHYYPA